MQLKTILNRVQKFKSFVYSAVYWVEGPDPARSMRDRSSAQANDLDRR